MNTLQLAGNNNHNMLEFYNMKNHYGVFSNNIDKLSWYKDDFIFSFIDRNVGVHAQNILDLCGGAGLVVEKIGAHRSDIFFDVADLSEEMLNKAASKLSSYSNVRIIKSNWIESSKIFHNKYDVILIKNALHVIDEYLNKLDLLKAISRPTTKIIVIETISPSTTALEFIRGLFSKVQNDAIKKNFFSTNSILDDFRKLNNWRLTKVDYHDQYIDIPLWIAAKGGDAYERYRIRNYILKQSSKGNIRKTMRISMDNEGSPKEMLRRQGLFVLERKHTD